MLEEVAAEAATEALKGLLNRVAESLRGKNVFRRRRLVRAFGGDLDDLVRDLRPCLRMGELTSILYVLTELGRRRGQDEIWRRLYDALHMVGSWFGSWDALREAIGKRRTAEILVQQLEGLNAVLFHASMLGVELSKLIAQLPTDDYLRANYKIATDRYDHFLTRYEGLLRRLPDEVGVIDRPPVLGQEHFFFRLGHA